MTTGVLAFRLYLATKEHFTTEKFDALKTANGVPVPAQQIISRNDFPLYEKIAHKYAKPQELCQVFVANFAYGNPGVVYDFPKSEENYKLWLKRRESITRSFQVDIAKIDDLETACRVEGFDPPEVFRMYLALEISPESLVILNTFFHFLEDMKNAFLIGDVYREEILKLQKLTPFVKFDVKRIKEVINEKV